MELTQSQLMIAGSLTGAAAHELNNIMGILGLRLEKIQEDLDRTSPGDAQSAEPAGGPVPERDEAARKDLAVMERNLGRAVTLIGHLQWLMRAGRDTAPCAEPEDFRRAILDAIEVQQAIYERKSHLNHDVQLVNVGPVPRGHLQLFLIAALQRIVLDLGRGATLSVAWIPDADGAAARLEIQGAAMAASPPAAAPGADGVAAILDVLVGQTESLAAGLQPDHFQAGDFSYVHEADDGTEGGGRRVRLLYRLRG